MNAKNLLLHITILLATLLFITDASDCGNDAMLSDPYFSLTPSWYENEKCNVTTVSYSDYNRTTCLIPGDVDFSSDSGWRVHNGIIEVSNMGQESKGHYSARLIGNSSVETDFSFTASTSCALLWQDFATVDISSSYLVDILDSSGNSIGAPFPRTRKTDPDNACDVRGCSFDARNILQWGLPAAGSYTVRFSGIPGSGTGALINDICLVCDGALGTPSASRSHPTSSSPIVSLSIASSIKQSPLISNSHPQFPSVAPSLAPSGSIDNSPAQSQVPSASINKPLDSTETASSSGVVPTAVIHDLLAFFFQI